MKTQIRLAILVLAFGLPIACTTFSPPPSPPTRTVPVTAQALMPTAAATTPATTPALTPTPVTTAPVTTAPVTAPALTPTSVTTTPVTASALTPTLTTTPPAGPKLTRGVFIVTAHNVALKPATYTNPAVDGIVIRTFWSNVQPAPDQFDWSLIDSQVQAASASGKKVILVVLPGAFTPQWALQGVQTAQFVVDYGFVQGTTVTLPMPWDATYLNRWFAFVRILGQRYDSNPAVVNIPAAGPTYISEEMSLPDDPAAVAKWKQLGYSLAKYKGAWQQTLVAYVQSFPTTQIALTFYPGLRIPDASAEAATRVDTAKFAFTSCTQRGLAVHPSQYAFRARAAR